MRQLRSASIHAASLIGAREVNNDAVEVTTVRVGRHRVHILVLCDGVGNREGAGPLARAVARGVCRSVASLVRRQRTTLPSRSSHIAAFDEAIRRGCRTAPPMSPPGAATTLVVVVRRGREARVFWAGDSRAYAFHRGEDGLQCLTEDHLAAGGAVRCFIRHDGRVVGTLSTDATTLLELRSAVLATSDGVHEYCDGPELQEFLRYFLRQTVARKRLLREDLERFLEPVAGDNYTMAISAMAR